MGAIQRIWQENRRFLLTVGSGLAPFLILNSCAIEGLLHSADRQRERNQRTEEEVNRLREQVFARAGEEMKNREDLGRIEKEIAGQYLTPTPADVPDARKGAPQIQFSARIDQIWTEVSRKASQKNVRIPEKITTHDLGVAHSDSPPDLERSAQYLEILGRALNVCVESGMVQIDRPVIYPEEALPVRKNEDAEMVYRRVGLTAHGPYWSFKRLLGEFQRLPPLSPPEGGWCPGFVQVRLLSLDAKGAGGTAALRGQLEFVGVALERTGAEGETVFSPPQSPRGGTVQPIHQKKLRRKP